MSGTATTSDVMAKLVHAACERHAPAEIHFEDRNGVVIIGHARLLGESNGCVLTDRPRYVRNDGPIPVGSAVRVHFAVRGKRHEFESVVEDDRRLVDVTPRDREMGLALRAPKELRESQRRAHLRISLVGYDAIVVGFGIPTGESAPACRLNVPRIEGWIVDLSSGGISVVIDREALRPIKKVDRFFLAFELPGAEEPFAMLGQVRHLREVKNGEFVRISMRFCSWGGLPLRRETGRISRFVAGHERRMLRRNRK